MLLMLEAIGGVQSGDSQILVQPDRETFLWELNRFVIRLKNAHADSSRVEAVFYYSGHADEFSLLLGQDKVEYPELRQELEVLPADMRICIFDACASGAFIRDKGGVKRAPLILTAEKSATGLAVLTSSSADEVSQESDQIKGSFFTHALISGMRGAADADRDGRVTLNEAFQFSFDQTLSQTQKTVWGPQHPSYKIQLSGNGEVVLTTLNAGQAWLRLAEDLGGTIYIHNQADRLVAEFPKMTGNELDVTLDAGSYRVLAIQNGAISEGRIVLKKGERHLLTALDMRPVAPSDSIARGDRQLAIGERISKKHGLILSTRMKFQSAFLNGETALIPGLELGLLTGQGLTLGIAVHARLGRGEDPQKISAYCGLFCDYQIPISRKWIFWGGGLLGLGYQEASLISASTPPSQIIMEPRLGLLYKISNLLQVGVGTGLNYGSGRGNPAMTLGLEIRFNARSFD
jgi:hypothetical protein